MTNLRERYRALDAEWRALLAGVAAAPALLVFAVVVGLIEGNLLPWACQGLACLYNTIVVMGIGIILGIWLILWALVRLTRRRWPRSDVRLWLLRLVAVASWAPLLWLGAIAIE